LRVKKAMVELAAMELLGSSFCQPGFTKPASDDRPGLGAGPAIAARDGNGLTGFLLPIRRKQAKDLVVGPLGVGVAEQEQLLESLRRGRLLGQKIGSGGGSEGNHHHQGKAQGKAGGARRLRRNHANPMGT
jgi:hypothetical protein